MRRHIGDALAVNIDLALVPKALDIVLAGERSAFAGNHVFGFPAHDVPPAALPLLAEHAAATRERQGMILGFAGIIAARPARFRLQAPLRPHSHRRGTAGLSAGQAAIRAGRGTLGARWSCARARLAAAPGRYQTRGPTRED